VDVSLIIRQRLEEFGLEQRELARAAQVTESYISQLLTRRRAPPAPNRTDIYDKMDRFLRLPQGELARLVDVQRKQELKKELSPEPTPLFREVREVVLRKCAPERSADLSAIFEKESFGELERLVTQTLLDVVKGVARQELENDHWLHMVAELSHHSYEETRVIVLEFLDTDIFHLSAEHCLSFLDPLIESWTVDLATFAIDIVLNPRVVSGHIKRFEFVERKPTDGADEDEPGFQEFLDDPALRGNATEEEVAFLKRLKFTGKRPTPLYYYRELQNLRDALHFQAL
jgi:transcriptional regulator with XRE-family HTH domain